MGKSPIGAIRRFSLGGDASLSTRWSGLGSKCNCRCKLLEAPRWIKRDRRDVAQPGRALAWGARGRQFKSARPDQIFLSYFLENIYNYSHPSGSMLSRSYDLNSPIRKSQVGETVGFPATRSYLRGTRLRQTYWGCPEHGGRRQNDMERVVSVRHLRKAEA